MPRDRTFSNREILETIIAAEPERRWNWGTVRAAVYKLADWKKQRRIAKDATGHILWAAFDSECESKPFAAMPLSDVIGDILEGSEPMRPAESVVAIQTLGRRAVDDPQKVLRVVRKALYANPRRFQRDEAGRWMVCDQVTPPERGVFLTVGLARKTGPPWQPSACRMKTIGDFSSCVPLRRRYCSLGRGMDA